MTADRSNGRQIEGWALDRVVYTKGKCNLAWGFFESRGAAEDEAARLGVRVVWATLILPADVDVDASPTGPARDSVSAAERAAVEWLDRAIRNCIPDIAEYARTIKAMLERRSPPCAGTGVEEALREAELQIQYLHDRFGETGSGNAVLARIRAALLYRRGEVGR